jgi:hypothetical protein
MNSPPAASSWVSAHDEGRLRQAERNVLLSGVPEAGVLWIHRFAWKISAAKGSELAREKRDYGGCAMACGQRRPGGELRDLCLARLHMD